LGLGFSVALALAAGIKVGSAENYFFEPLFWALLLLGNLRKPLVSDSGFALLLLLLGVSLGGQKATSYMTQYYIEEGKADSNPLHEEQIRFLSSALREGDCFVAEDREISLGLPRHAAMVPVDIHYTTFREGIYRYTNWEAASGNKGLVKFWVGGGPLDSLYGVNFEGRLEQVAEGVWRIK
jgi:hypothetical protein